MKLQDLFENHDLTELFTGQPLAANWAKKVEMGVPSWTTSFDFKSGDRTMRVTIELIDDYDQIMGKYMFRANGLELNPEARGFGVNFDVDNVMYITGELGTAAGKLISEVLARCLHFWNQHEEFSYVVFTGGEASRNRLYAAMSRRLASMAGARMITKRDDFMIYLPSAESTPHRMDERIARVKGRWALVSRKTGRPLQYYHGAGRPSPEWAKKVERRVQYFKHRGG